MRRRPQPRADATVAQPGPVERAGVTAASAAPLLEAVLDALPVGVVVQREDGLVVRNALARDLAASRRSEVLADAAVREVLAAARLGLRQERTVELHGPPRRTLVVSGRPVTRGAAASDGDGAAAATVAVIEDVTERRRLEAVRRDFVANVSHELRTPVGAITVLGETLSDEDDPEVVRGLAVRMLGEARRAARLMEDLLDLSRIEAAGADAHDLVDVGDVVAAAVERVGAAADDRGVAVDIAVAGEPRLLGDQGQLVSAVHNLLDNAVKYSEPGHTVEVRAEGRPPWVVVTIRDYGIGIPARELGRIFERFYRVDPARSRQTGGTGLGLAIVRHVATNHGGDVTVESREGEGSTFTIRLPEWRP